MGNTVKRENYNYNRNQPKNQPTYILKPFPDSSSSNSVKEPYGKEPYGRESYGCDTYPEACFSAPRAPTQRERKVWEGVL